MPKSKCAKKEKKQVAVKKNEVVDLSSIGKLLLKGDLSGLNEQEKMQYYINLCKSFKLNPLTKPFDYIQFKGKEILYANKNATEQLRINNGISVYDVTTDVKGGIYMVTVKVKDKTGREDIGIGAVSIEGLKGGELADAIMKAETKAKRRATLSIAGLGMLDETELDIVYNYDKQKINNQLTEPERIDVMKRQVMIEKFKKVSSETRKKLHDMGYSIDDAMEYCNSHNWDEQIILANMEKDYGTRNEEDAF